MKQNGLIKKAVIVPSFVFFGALLSATALHAAGPILTNPLGADPKVLVTPADLVGRIVTALLGVTGTLALIMVVYGGTQIALNMKSGNDSGLAAGKKTLTFALLGLIISLGGFLVIDTILGAVGGALGLGG
jgi:hypothetical protein